MPQASITKICLKITCLEFHSNLPGDNELRAVGLTTSLSPVTIWQSPWQYLRFFISAYEKWILPDLVLGLIQQPSSWLWNSSMSLYSLFKLQAHFIKKITYDIPQKKLRQEPCQTIAINADTVQCRYNAVNFLQNPHNRHPIARPWGRDMGCL